MEPVQFNTTTVPRRKRAPIGLIVLAAVAGAFVLAGGAAYLFILIPVAHAKKSENQLKQILLAVHNFHDSNLKLPDGNHYQHDPATQFRDQQKVHRFSWRVDILPFINHKPLYDRFKFDEPWDSEHNLRVAQEMPDMYRAPGDKSSNHTSFVAIADKDGAFPVPTRELPNRNGERQFGDFIDGLRTIAMTRVEGSGIVWTDPTGDISIDDFVRLAEQGAVSPPGTGKVRGPSLLVGNMDGSVLYLPRKISAKTIRALCTRDGGELIPGL